LIKWTEVEWQCSTLQSVGSILDDWHRILEIATFQHAKELGFGDDVVRPQGWMWLVVKVATTIHQKITDSIQVKIKTEVILGLHSSVLWLVSVFDHHETLRLEQALLWALADQKTNQLLSIQNRIPPYPFHREVAKRLSSMWFPKLTLSSSTTLIGQYHVSSQDIDQNNHVHNTTFIAILFQKDQRFPRSYRVDYQDMMFLNETILVETSIEQPHLRRFVIVRENSPKQVCLASIDYENQEVLS